MKFFLSPFQKTKSVLEKFIQYEASSGLILLVITIVALILSNSPFGENYFSFWEKKISLQIDDFELTKPLILWINDGLMAIFFFLVGLEIKRELLVGELSSFQQAILPLGAALGGMILPAILFLTFEREATTGWAIPMATDIAFSLGIIKLLGSRVPHALKVFLTAFAIIDDLGAVLIIAVFYTTHLKTSYLVLAFVIMIVLGLMNVFEVRKISFYILLGIFLWYGFLKSGIHPTIAAVILAFFIPAKPRVELSNFQETLKETNNVFSEFPHHYKRILLNPKQQETLENLETSIENIQSPLQRLEHMLHGFVAFFVMPVFAFANAGVPIEASTIGALSFTLGFSLVFGKAIGLSLGTFLFMKLFKASLPEGTKKIHFLGLGFLGGVGFTMALFITNLSYTEAILLNQARIGILMGSAVSGMIGYTILYFSSQPSKHS
ncbi:MAG: Na+/H+ antiporter NhaA [Leptospiraceae bacterium]|nr:Na+/H+ antiporter NhaA [Leptospiraceae bacterium]MDW7977087.1 Na+/H+ antiporter NhaA [Leptospiraceae bacterium]